MTAEPVVVTGTTSHLHDEVEIITADSYTDPGGDEVIDWNNPVVAATLPAYVGYQTAGLDNSEVGRTAFIEELRVITPAFNFQPPDHRIRWRGEAYLPNGPAMLRRRRGRDLTLTVPIKLVTG